MADVIQNRPGSASATGTGAVKFHDEGDGSFTMAEGARLYGWDTVSGGPSRLTVDHSSGALKVYVVTGGGSAVTIADGADVAQGAVADAAYAGSGSSTLVGLLKGIYAKLASALSVTQSGTWTVQPGNTANTTAWKVDGSAVTQPVSGTFWQTTQPVSGTVTVQQATAANLKVDPSGVTSPVSAASLPLPAGASTEATLSTLNSKVQVGAPNNAGNESSNTYVQGLAVLQAYDASASVTGRIKLMPGDTTSGLWANVKASVLPTGASTETTLSALNTKVPSNLTVTSTRLLVDPSGVTSPVSLSTAPTSGTATVTQVASSASSVTLLASNASRKGFAIFNDSTQAVYVKFGTTASASSYTVKMAAGAYYESPSAPVYTGRIDGIWVSANGNALVTELT